jgi:hypothetical protein
MMNIRVPKSRKYHGYLNNHNILEESWENERVAARAVTLPMTKCSRIDLFYQLLKETGLATETLWLEEK